MIQNVKFPCFVYTHGNYVARQKKETKEKTHRVLVGKAEGETIY